MKDFFRKHFGFKGRMRRRTYIIKAFVCMLIMLFCVFYIVLSFDAITTEALTGDPDEPLSVEVIIKKNISLQELITFIIENITIILLGSIPFLVYMSATSRRLYDMDSSSCFDSFLIFASYIFWFLITPFSVLIPYLGIYLLPFFGFLFFSINFLMLPFLCIYPGTKGANKYGEDPRVANNIKPDNIYNPEVLDNKEDKAE